MKINISSLFVIIALFAFVSCNQGTTEAPVTNQPSQQNNNKVINSQQKKAVNTPTLVEAKPQKNTQKNNSHLKNAEAGGGTVNWVSVNDLEQKQKTDKRKVMVDLYTDWCGWCKRMDKATFQNPKISEYLNENFYAVKFNAEDKNNIKFNNKDYKFVAAGRRGYNELAYSFANGKMSYPTIAFLDEDLNRINSFPGYKQPNQFDAVLKYIDGNHYKTQDLGSFQQSFKSSLPATAPPTNKTKANAGKFQVGKTGTRKIQLGKDALKQRGS